MNRRKFLKQSIAGVGTSLLAGPAIDFFLGNLMRGMISRAYALDTQGESGFLEKKFLNLILDGGPAGWYWNLPLKPNGNDPFKYGKTDNPNQCMIWNKFVPDPTAPGGYSGIYDHTKVGSVYLPYLWGGKVATPSGSDAMSKLAQNMMFMRGIKGLDNHELSRSMQVRPTGGPSLGGEVADRSITPIPAIGYSVTSDYFKSKKGINEHPLTATRAFTSAFSSFTGGSTLISGSTDVGAKIDRVLDAMKNQSSLKHGLLPQSYADRVNAKKLMLKDFTALQNAYNLLVTKYQMLITRSFSDPTLRLEGVDALAIPGSAVPQMRVSNNSSDQGIFYAGNDLSSLTQEATTLQGLAEEFAISEFMLTGGGSNQSFSSSINLRVSGGVANCVADLASIAGSQALNQSFTFGIDAHTVGAHASLVLFSRYFRAISSALFELTHQLKSVPIAGGNLFDQSVIAITSEFSRSDRSDQGGSDHGWTASTYTLLSGMISAPSVIGNINVEAGGKGKGGTWGDAAPVPYLQGTQAVLGNAISTVSTLLEISSPTPNNAPLVVKNSSTGKVSAIAAVATPTNVPSS